MSILTTTSRTNFYENAKTIDDLLLLATENLKDSRALRDGMKIQYDLGYLKGLEDAKKMLTSQATR